MATAKLYEPIDRRPSSPRNAFDIGYSTLFTSPAGMLLPAYVEDVKEGDTIKLSLSSVTRTRPVNTAAFMSFDEKVDFWFVPYRLLWSDYKNWRLSQAIRRDSYANLNIGRVETVPYTTWASIGSFVLNLNNYGYTGYFTDPSCSFFLRQMDLLNYGIPPIGDLLLFATDDTFGIYTTSDSSSEARPPQGSTASDVDVLASVGTRPGLGSGTGATGNVRPPVNSNTSFARLLSEEYALYDSYLGSPLNYFRLAAYQCIYMASYRNEEYEKLDPSYYNVDNLFYSGSSNTSDAVGGAPSNPEVGKSYINRLTAVIDDAPSNVICLSKLFTPRFKNWRKDVFTGVRPTNLMSVNGMEIPSDIPGLGAFGDSFKADGNVTSDGSPVTSEGQYNDSDVYYDYLEKANAYFPYLNLQNTNYTLLASNIRLLLAQDKFARRSLYADKDFSSQMKAIFGADVPEPDVPRYLGTHSSNVQINEIVATSAGEASFGDDSSTSVLGEMAGKGYQSSNGFVFEETFKEDGIVMGIHYLMPRNNYNSYRINKFNTKLSRWDYYYPDFDGLGFSPVLARELSIAQHDVVAPAAPHPTNILGYSPRYYEYKERQNEVHGVFMSGQTESNWTLTNNKEYVDSGSNPNLFKIFPNVTDPIFTMAYDGSQSTDPFMCYYNYEVTRVSNMEILGIPNL